MTADALRAAIAADCPHRLPDYDAHRAPAPDDWQPTTAFRVLWRTEHRISSWPPIEWRIADLHAQAVAADDYPTAKALLEQASECRAAIKQQVIKEMSDD